MLPIEKLPESQALLEYKNEKTKMGEYPTYDGFTAYGRELDEAGIGIPRNETPFYKLREQLLKEQKYVCAYCGQKVQIVENEHGKAQMKTEHFVPQDGTVENDLNYQNLLGCCLGNDNKKGENHCDSMKGDGHFLSITNPSTWHYRDEEIFYSVKNESQEVLLFSSNESKDKELTGRKKGCLNLNHDRLKSDRFSVFKNVIKKQLGEDKSTWKLNQVEDLITEYADSSDGYHKEFKDFVLWLLEDWIKKNGATQIEIE
jgi:uncharacterized protein (TIGR02646 family)